MGLWAAGGSSSGSWEIGESAGGARCGESAVAAEGGAWGHWRRGSEEAGKVNKCRSTTLPVKGCMGWPRCCCPLGLTSKREPGGGRGADSSKYARKFTICRKLKIKVCFGWILWIFAKSVRSVRGFFEGLEKDRR